MNEDASSNMKPQKKAAGASKKAMPVLQKRVKIARDHIVLKDSIKIFFDEEVPEFKTGSIKAYRAEKKSGTQKECYALICERHLLPRIRQSALYRRIMSLSANFLIDFDVVYWPPLAEERYALIYTKTARRTFVEKEDSVALGMNPSEVSADILPPLVEMLRDFKEKDFFHGSLRLSNLYAEMDGGKIAGVVFGDGLSAPYGYFQPVVYQTIPLGMADPIAKGYGNNSDDVYALGVCLVMMLRHNDPLEGKTDEEILEEKVKLGSYVAITGKDRFTGSILELLRGMLHDDPSQRWTPDEILTWIDGCRISPKQNISARNGARPLEINGKKFSQVIPFSMEIPKNITQAVSLLEDGSVEQWLDRSIEDKELTTNLKNFMRDFENNTRGKNYAERLVSAAIVALNPSAPLYYKGAYMMPEGVGTLLVNAVEKKEDLSVITEVFSYELWLRWLSVQFDAQLDVSALVAVFDNCKNLVKKTKMGHGLERALYVLCPQGHCMSPIFDKHIVRDSLELITALEQVFQASKETSSRYILDRHMSAFLIEKDSKMIESFLYDFDSSESYKVILANLYCLASIQSRYKVKSVKNLAKAFLLKLECAFMRYHDSEKREKIREQVEKMAAGGDLYQMAKILGDYTVVKQDFYDFRSALNKYAELKVEQNKIEENIADRDRFNKVFGREIPAFVSAVLAGVIIVMMALSFFSKHAPF